MRGPEDPYPDVLRDVMLARIEGKIKAALDLMEAVRFKPAAKKVEKWPTRA